MSGTDYTTTPNLGLFKPNYDMDDGQWGTHLNSNADVLDGLFGPGGNAPFLPLTGGTVAPGNIAIGTGTGTPTLTLNGAAGTNKGIDWQNAGTSRWRLQTDALDNLGLYAYDAGGTFQNTVFNFQQATQTASFVYQISANNSTAPIPGGVVGTTLSAHNTGGNAAYGHLLNYTSGAGGTGFDTALGVVSIFDTIFTAGVTGQGLEALWIVSQSPNDQTHPFGCNIGELNIVNRGPDSGWMRDRLTPNPTGGLLIVPETTVFGGTGGGEGKNATYAYSASRSGNTNSTGFPAKFYNVLLIEPNSTVGQTGRGIYATGDITGVASQYPYGPLQLDGTWLHGIDHTKAVYTDGNAQTMLAGQSLAWITGTTGTPTGTATISSSGSGANVSLTLTPAGTGTVALNGGISNNLAFNSGVNFGSQLAPGAVDLSRHIALFGTNYGLNVASGNINVICGGSNVGAFSTAGLSGPVGVVAPSTGAFTTLTSSGLTTLNTRVNVGNGAGTATSELYLNGATAQNNGLNWQHAGQTQWRLVEDAANNLTLYVYNAGAFVGTALAVSQTKITASLALQCAGNVGFYNTAPVAKPTVSGAKGSNAALGSLIAALVALGLVADTTTA